MDIKTSIVTIEGSKNPTQALLDSLIITEPDGNVIEPTEEQKWALIRAVRDELLNKSDWVLVKYKERPLDITTKINTRIKAWKKYRQTLRDIPQKVKKPEQAVFPELPKERPNPRTILDIKPMDGKR